MPGSNLKNMLSTLKTKLISNLVTQQISRRVFTVIFFGLCFYSVYRIHLIGPNAYEQGFMYTAAVASSEGLLPNRDFFMPYGPTTSILQGAWLRFFGTSLVQLQYATIFSLVLTAFLLFLILRMRLGSQTSSLLTLLWFMTGPHGNPWSSIWSNFFALFGTAVIYKASQEMRKGVELLLLFLGTVSLVLGVLSRIQIILVVFLVSLWILRAHNLDIAFKRSYAKIFSIVIIIFTFLLGLNGMLIPWIEQCIKWPTRTYVGQGPGFTIPRIADSLFIPLIPFTILVVFFLFNWALRVGTMRSPIFHRILFLIFFLAASCFLLNLRFQPKRSPQTLRNPEVLFVTFAQKFSYFFTFLVLSLYIVRLFSFVISVIRRRDFSSFGLFDALAVGLLSQLYPLHDSYHIFVVTPGLLVALFYSRKFESGFLRVLKVPLFNIQYARNLSFVLLIFLLIQNLLLGTRTDYKFSTGILDGIYSRSYFSDQLESQMLPTWARSTENVIFRLSKIDHNEKIRFFCKEGLFSAASGSYLSSDPYFVDWGPIPQRRLDTSLEFYCRISEERLRALILEGRDLIFKENFPEAPMSIKGSVYYALLRKQTR